MVGEPFSSRDSSMISEATLVKKIPNAHNKSKNKSYNIATATSQIYIFKLIESNNSLTLS